MNFLIPTEELERAHERYTQQQQKQAASRPKTHAKILVEVATEDPTLTVRELAEAAERSPSWVRKTLKKAGITLAKQPHRQEPETQP